MNSETTPAADRKRHHAAKEIDGSSPSSSRDNSKHSAHNGGDNEVRRRRNRPQRDPYRDNPIGGYSSSSDSDSSYQEARRRRKKREARRRLYLKSRNDKLPLRVPLTKFLHSEVKNDIVAFLGEFVGTTMFLFFAFGGTQVANIGQGNGGDTTDNSTTGAATGFNIASLLYISFCFGYSLMVNAWIFFRISGGLFNPAVTLALYLLEALSPRRAVLLFIAQLTSACFASYIVSVLFPTAFNVRTTLAPGTSIAQGIFIEAMGTAELIFTIIMLAAEKHRATYIAPVGIGLALFIAELVGVYYTGGSYNPARSFGPCAVSHDFDGTHWIYWVGPLIGTLMAVGFYKLNKFLEYELANPGQDGDAENDPTQNDNHDLAHIREERALEVEAIKEVEDTPGDGGFMEKIESELGRDPEVMEADAVVGVEKSEGDLEKMESQRSKPSRIGSKRREVDLEAGFGASDRMDHLSREKDYNLMPTRS